MSGPMETPHRGRHVLVIGAGGFIGRRVTRMLAETGASVTGFDVFQPEDLNGADKWHVGNVDDEALLAAVLAGVDTVIYLASGSLPATANHDLTREIASHVAITVKAAELSEAAGVRRFVFASSGGTVYGQDSDRPLTEDSGTFPRNAYGASKISIEHYLSVLGRLRSMKTISLRLSNPYGPGQMANRNQGFVAAAMQHAFDEAELSIWGDGTVVRDFIYVDDVVEAFIACLSYEGPSDVFNIGSGQGVSLNEMLHAVRISTGKAVRVAYEADRAIDVKVNILDVAKAATRLGWRPEVSLNEGLALTKTWWLSRSSAD